MRFDLPWILGRRRAPGYSGAGMAYLLVLGACLIIVGVLPSVAQAVPSSEPFGIVPGSFHVLPSSLQAGGHADLTTSFDFAHDNTGRTYNDVRNIVVKLLLASTVITPLSRRALKHNYWVKASIQQNRANVRSPVK